MAKIRIYFPLVEAGFGHIMPANSVCDKFIEKYGNDDRLEIIRNKVFAESLDEDVRAYEKGLINALKSFQKNHAFGFFANSWDWTLHPRLISFFTMRWFKKPGLYKKLEKRLEEINPDVVFSTHWSTNYVARNYKKKKIVTSLLCPDVRIDRLFLYPCDLRMTPTEIGYNKAINKFGNNEKNLKKINFCMRQEVQDVLTDKIKQREKLNLPKNKFTITIMEGGYGNGRLKTMCEMLTKLDIPITIIAICGKNPELEEYLRTLKVNPNITFIPFGYCPNGVDYIGASDLFLGKSGINVVNECCYFNVPAIITSYTNFIEQFNGEYYIKYIGNAQRIHNVKKIVKAVEMYAKNPSLLDSYVKNCEKAKDNFGSEKAADYLYQLIEEKFFKSN